MSKTNTLSTDTEKKANVFRLLIIIIIGGLFGVFGAYYINKTARLFLFTPTKIDNSSNVTTSRPRQPIDSDYSKRLFNQNFETGSLDSYPEKLLSQLLSADENELIALKCQEGFVNDGVGGYYYRDTDSYELTRELTDRSQTLLISQAAKALTENKKLISGRFCQTEDDRVIFEYNAGNPETYYLVGDNVTTYVTVMGKNDAFKEGVLVTTQPVWPYAGCDPPLELTKSNILYYSCGITRGSTAENLFFQIDLNNNTVNLVDKCTYTFDPKVNRNCTSL